MNVNRIIQPTERKNALQDEYVSQHGIATLSDTSPADMNVEEILEKRRGDGPLPPEQDQSSQTDSERRDSESPARINDE